MATTIKHRIMPKKTNNTNQHTLYLLSRRDNYGKKAKEINGWHNSLL